MAIPARQRASEASLRQRVEDLRAENQRLREENRSLRTELALAYGSRRDSAGEQEPSLDR
jgi:regulator of replication initiation timing